MTVKTIKTLQLRIKDKHAKALGAMAREVNQVFNFCNETSSRAIRSAVSSSAVNLRGARMDSAQIAAEIGMDRTSVAKWIDEFRRQGLLAQRDGPQPARGHAPKQYTVAAAWIGGA